jgi:hypothetical protein
MLTELQMLLLTADFTISTLLRAARYLSDTPPVLVAGPAVLRALQAAEGIAGRGRNRSTET